MWTMKAMPNNGVARLTIGIDTNAAMNRPAVNTVAALSLRIALASAGERKRIAASSKYSRPSSQAVAMKKIDEAGAGEQHEGQRDQIDQDRQQRGLDAFGDRDAERQRGAGALRRIMLALDMVGDVVDEHARDQRGDRRHQENRRRARRRARPRSRRSRPGC